MNPAFSNLNNPESVKALLDQLRASSAFAELTAPAKEGLGSSTNASTYSSSAYKYEPPLSEPLSTYQPEPVVNVSAPTMDNDQISSLLSLLKPSLQPGASSSPYHTPPPTLTPRIPSLNTRPPSPPPSVPADVRHLTFQQSLIPLSRVLEDRKAIAVMKQLKEDQVQFEKKLHQNRLEIIGMYETKVKALQRKASIIGVDPTPRELEALHTELERQLLKFDSEQVLAGWDALIFKQQQALQALNVPSMFATTHETDRERQQRIIQVISDSLSEHASS